MRFIRWLIVLAAILMLSLPSLAETLRFPGEPNTRIALFPSQPSAVTVDVLDVGGLQIGNNLPTTQLQIDATNSSVWTFDLASVAGYPLDCTTKTYLVRWLPDAVNCATSPALCVFERVDVGGAFCKSDPSLQVSYVHAQAVVAAQGITQPVLDFFNRTGRLPILWREIRHAADRDFVNPDSVEWEVYFYSSATSADGVTTATLKCTVSTTTDPNTTLPSSGSCTGAP